MVPVLPISLRVADSLTILLSDCRSRMMNTRKGFSLIELLLVVAIILIIAGIAIPNLLKSRIAANESAAVNSLRSITTAQISYFISHNGYSADLDTLGPTGADLLPDTISAAPYQHSGYQFATTGTTTSFTANSVPVDPGRTGVRSFCTDTPSALYFSPTESGCDPATSAVLGQ